MRATLSVLIKSDDGRYVQAIRTVFSRDGKVLTRRLQLKAPDGEQTWTEVYEENRGRSTLSPILSTGGVEAGRGY